MAASGEDLRKFHVKHKINSDFLFHVKRANSLDEIIAAARFHVKPVKSDSCIEYLRQNRMRLFAPLTQAD